MYTLDEDEVAIKLVISNICGRLQSLITTPEKPQILVILCENEAIGGIYILT